MGVRRATRSCGGGADGGRDGASHLVHYKGRFVRDTTKIVVKVVLVGIGGTIFPGLCALLLQRLASVPAGR